MDKEMEEYYISLRNDMRKEQMKLKIEFMDRYIEQLGIHAPNAVAHIDMDTIYTDTPYNLWTYEMHQVYTDARYNYAKLQLVESYCPEE